MICGNCGNQKAFRLFYAYQRNVCDQCGDFKTHVLPDLYLVPGQPEDNLPDDPCTGRAPIFETKRQMAAYLKKHHLIQVRDRDHGAFSMPTMIHQTKKRSAARPIANFQSVDRTTPSWHESRMLVKHFRDMGIDQRRQAYWKAVKGL